MSMSDLGPFSFRSTVGADLYRYGKAVSLGSFARHYLFTPGFKYTFWMRAALFLSQESIVWRPVYYLCRLILFRCGRRFGISIPYNTRIGPGLYIGHYGGIVVNDQAILGCDCNINHEVTIGVRYGGKHPGVPAIGDRVYLGPGCKVLGGITLGNDVAAGANSVVVESVVASGVVAGVPAKLISRKGSSDYVVNTDGWRILRVSVRQ